MIGSISGGGIAAIIFAAFWGLLVLFLAYLLLKLGSVLESTRMLVDGIRQETVPLLGEVKTTVTSVNKELERVDTMLESVGAITKNVERVTGLIQQTVSSPLVKIAAAGAGLSRMMKRRRRGRTGSASYGPGAA